MFSFPNRVLRLEEAPGGDHNSPLPIYPLLCPGSVIASLHLLGYYPCMTEIDEANESQANNLCKSCGLCCTGHLFSRTKLRSAELDSAQALGLNVFRSDPRHRGFSQPCPLWQGQCTIYTSPHYPHFCRTFKCKLLKEVLGESTTLQDALTVVQEAKRMIHELEVLLPGSPDVNFRERLVAYLEGHENTDSGFRLKADALLIFYKDYFGVKDLVEKPDEE